MHLQPPNSLEPSRAAGAGPFVRIRRERLEARLAARGAAPIAVLSGPAGAGKSVLLEPLRDDPSILYFRAGNEHATFARFVAGLAHSLTTVAPGAAASFPRAWERALQSRSAGTVLAHWLAEHLQGVDRHLVIDDLHHAGADASIAAFIGKLAELRGDASLTLALRTVGALPVALWMARRRMDRPIDEAELRFDRGEIARAAELLAVPLAAADVEALLTATGGTPVAVTFALSRRRAEARGPIAVPATFREIAANMYARRSGTERAFLFSAAAFPTIDDGLLRLSGWDDAATLRAGMASDAAFMWDAHADGSIRFHDRFRDDLARRFADCDDEFRSTIARRTVASLRTAGRYAEALEVATHQHLTAAAGELLDEHGFGLLESGNIGAISEALDALETPDRALGARAMALRGYLDSRNGRLDTAEAWFRLGLENAADDGTRAAIALYYSRELAVRRREDTCTVLAPIAACASLPADVHIDVQSSYAQALTAADRLDEAVRRTDTVLALLDADAPAALRARVLARAAYVALEAGALGVARERALAAAPLAVAASLYEVAASSYSVLYNVAMEIDDDAPASLEYLRCLRDVSLKSGTLRFDLYALIGIYGLTAETGDDAELARLDTELAAVDKHDANVEIMEGLLPAKALAAAWSGRFAEAAELLRPTAEQQATSVRRALCWAKIGLYFAAAGQAGPAVEAIRAADAALNENEVHSTQFELTLLTLGLAAWAGGDPIMAWRRTQAADRASLGAVPRLQALRAALGALVAGTADPAIFPAVVADALAQLRRVSFGGMARLIEALPCAGAPARAAVGRILAEDALPARFAAAVSADAAAGTSALLDAIGTPFYVELGVADRFERWVSAHGPDEALDPARLAAVRAALRTYRPPAPALLRLSDDVDTAIDRLFEQLDAAAPLMAEHSRAVSAWCSRIARAFGLSEREVAYVTRSGLIHDIGKTFTPPAILQAPRALTDEEWATMREHAAAGARMVSELPLLAPFAPIVRGHHERLDGKGYPDGLRANAIPFAARIVSVADSFNAMIGRRPYRGPMSPTAALSELERHRYTQFDPEVVDALTRIVQGRVIETLPAASREQRHA